MVRIFVSSLAFACSEHTKAPIVTDGCRQSLQIKSQAAVFPVFLLRNAGQEAHVGEAGVRAV